MKLIRAEIANFGSYKELSIDFENKGLTLVSGATGSGKSTLCDIVPWILFGCTAKDGAVDEVISWNAEGPTKGTLYLTASTGNIAVTRIRHGKSGDLYYCQQGPYVRDEFRGKDILDTQKLLEQHLGITKEAFLAGSYYHEFSETAAFFTAKAKERKELTENLADLSLATTLTERLTAYRKDLKKERESLTGELAVKDAEIKQLAELYVREVAKALSWAEAHKRKLKALQTDATEFQERQETTIKSLVKKSLDWHNQFYADKLAAEQDIANTVNEIKELSGADAKIADIEEQLNTCSKDKCSECGAPKGHEKKAKLTAALHLLERDRFRRLSLERSLVGAKLTYDSIKKRTNPYTDLIEKEKTAKNVYIEQLADAEMASNPHDAQTIKLQKASLDSKRLDLQEDLNAMKLEESDVELLLDITAQFRSLRVKNTIIELERSTNDLLTKHFDAEIRVKFDMTTADKLEVEITKDSNSCTFTQLSKGQRCLLKLCFGVSVMSVVSNHKGVSFNTVFFDESLDGLDEPLKLKAYDLFCSLATKYENIFVVEHNEMLKTSFENRIQVKLVSGWSELCQS